MRPVCRQVDLPAHMCIDEGASFRENHDETLALLANKEGMSIHLLSWLKARQVAMPMLQTDFIASGREHAKLKGALEDAAPEAEGTSAQPEPEQTTEAPQALPSSGPAPLSLQDVTTPPAKKARCVASPVAPSESSGVLII